MNNKNIPLKKEAFNYSSLSKENVAALFIIILTSFFIYLPVLHNGFVNWDDDNYIQNNPLIFSIHLKEYFTRFFFGNYHPLTLLALGIEYQLFGLNETGYHAVNLLFHLLNVILVFYTILLLSDKVEVALIACLLFGIHPMHVESVAWASELKDLLYTFFFLLSYIFYLKYSKDNLRKNYFYALTFFILSLFSKAMAVSLPILMLLTDYFKGRKIDKRLILEKTPFLLLSFTFGIVAVIAQKATGAIQDFEIFSFPERIIFASYGFITYLVKLVLPLKLCAYYPYPVGTNDAIPLQYYFYLPILAGLMFFGFYSLRFNKIIFFGIGFFTITVFLVLQLLPVGGTIMSDRYSYIPSIGIFYLAGEGLFWFWKKRNKIPVTILLTLIAVFYSFQTYSRTRIWKSGATLWDDVINQYQIIPFAYNNRGFIYFKEKYYSAALNYYNKAIQLSPEFHQALNNRGVLMTELLRNKEALEDFNKAIEFQPKFAEAYNNRGLLLISEKRFEDAVKDYSKAIEINPDYAAAYNNRGNQFINENKFDAALADLNIAIKLQPNNAKSYVNRGTVFIALNNAEEALRDFNKSIELRPDYSQAYFNRAVLFMNEKRNDEAIIDFSKTIELEPRNTAAYVNRAVILQNENKFEDALKDYNKAIEINPKFLQSYFNRGILLIKVKQYDNAINDFTKLIELDSTNAMAFYNKGIAEYYLNRKKLACDDIQQAAKMGLQPARALFDKFCQ